MKDSKGRTIKKGMSVDMPEPDETDNYHFEFTGTVSDFSDHFVLVQDQDGEAYSIEPERLTISEDETVTISPEELARVLATWLVEASADTLLRIYNENFDAPITFDSDNYVFVVPIDEADRVGMEYDGNADYE